ncbi:MAG TPA: translation initiation factor IF-3 [Candidatus Kapabacteria bacterium]
MAKQFFKKPTPGAGGPPKPNARQNRWSREMPVKNAGVRMNEQIRVPEIRVVDEDGVVGVMSPQDAMRLANERGVDLIEIAPNAQPPVCKLMEFGKWRYEQQKRDRVAKATQFKQLTKEARFHPSTDTHDFDFKLRHAREWIEEGHKVKATVQFKGRQIAYKEFGEKLLKRFSDALADIAKAEGNPSLAGKLMTMMFSPKGKKSDDKKDDSPEVKVEKGPSELGLQLKKKLDA